MNDYKIAILFSGKKDHESPSNQKAIDKFFYAASFNSLTPTIINYNYILDCLDQFDALFIRDVTYEGNSSHLFIKKAEELDLVVMDDSKALMYGSNKIKAYEIAKELNLLIPKTRILTLNSRISILNFPVILKSPQGYGSKEIFKINNRFEFIDVSGQLFEKYKQIILQEFLFTPFDWRIGVLNNEPLFAMKYHMLKGDWKVADTSKEYLEDIGFGKCECIDLCDVPKEVLNIAVKVSYKIGDGLYGVDIKQYEGKYYFIEVNDNTTIDNNVEDVLLEDTLYFEIMKWFYEKIKNKKQKIT